MHKDKIKLLEIFDNPYPGRDYSIVHTAEEFTSLCPVTGHPDFGKIIISYIPDKKCVELKSLKYYLQSYRNEGIFFESLTNKILDDLVKVLKPRNMIVTGEFKNRGGIRLTIKAEYLKK